MNVKPEIDHVVLLITVVVAIWVPFAYKIILLPGLATLVHVPVTDVVAVVMVVVEITGGVEVPGEPIQKYTGLDSHAPLGV